ncbi:MAG: polysaccharide deacetylase family protein [Syntrophomonadaceae bacterium]|jgi:peptidoglycan/xylan/chitin deacetylase (PgdA/CDA1 family)
MPEVRTMRLIVIGSLAMVLVCALYLFAYRWHMEQAEVEKSLFALSSGFNHKVITRIDTGGKKLVALTFDDGPDPRFTPEVLDILEKNNIQATFFVVGENAQVHTDIIKRQIAAGHEIENHTYSHPNLAAGDELDTEWEILRAQGIITELTQKRPVYFRPPKRLFKNSTLKVAEAHGYTTVLWTIGLEHYKSKTVAAMAKRVIKAARPGTILLAHDGRLDRTRTLKALPLVIKGYKQKGYQFVTLSELIASQKAIRS